MESPDRSYPSDSPSSMFKNAQKVLTWSGNENTKTAQDIAIFMATAGQYQSVQSFLSFYNTGKVPRNPRSRVYKQYAQLDYYPPSTSGLLLKFTKGTYYYMCTRNNNFTNRSQKGRLIVKNSD